MQAFHRVLTEDLRRPIYLTSEEVRGNWTELFPNLAACLPAPYPIFGTDEERIITYGYPILISDGIWRLRRELEKAVTIETEYRLAGGGEKDQVMQQRDRYLRSVSNIIENVLMNDYGRGLMEVFLLFHSGDVVRSLGQVAKMAQLQDTPPDRKWIEERRQSIAAIFADLLQRAALSAGDRLRQLADGPSSVAISPVLGVLCHEMLVLTESHPPADLRQLGGHLKARLREDADGLVAASEHSIGKLRDLIRKQPEIGSLLSSAGAGRLRLDRPTTLLEPRLLDALTAADLVASVDLSPNQVDLLRELGLRLKRFELLASLRRRIRPMERRGNDLVLGGGASATPIAPSTRPFDFAAPGVVESLVRRCGLVYDLTNFTALLEAVRKEGHAAEEKALQFMYVFQNRLEEIRQRRVLNFEKYLGDGALYSSRRATRVLGAACEIQRLYDNLRHSGFPFDQGIRIAVNFGTYRLLPMLNRVGDSIRFEFFGHGIVELARLTTGKSTREVDEIAEFLVHSGFSPERVDSFLAPLLEARRGQSAGGARTYAAAIDDRGELINEGIVLTAAFLEEVEKEFDAPSYGVLEYDDLRWVVFPADSRDPDSLFTGIRHLGVARLKGLSPQELFEAMVWEELPSTPRTVESVQSLIDLVRQIAQPDVDEPDQPEEQIPEDLVVLTYFQDNDERAWVFGEYRHSDDVLLHAIQMPIQTPDLDVNTPLETWLFKNRFELSRLYEGVRRSTSGLSTPLSGFRQRDGYLACFLCAPHRSP
jgi:hypothetical protein